MTTIDPDMELCVIGCLLEGGQEVVRQYSEQLRLELFWRDDCRKALEIILARDQTGKPTDTILLNEEWKTRLSNPAPVDILTAGNTVVGFDSLGYYLAELIERQRVSESKNLVSKLVTKTNHNQLKAAELRTELESIFDLADINPYPEYNGKGAAIEMTNDLERRFNLQGKRSGVVTGFKRLDAILDGIQYSELTVMGARPSHGKTAFGLNILHCAVFYQEIPTLFVTLEMSVPALMRRLLSAAHTIPLKELKTGQLTEKQHVSVAKFNAVVSHKPVHFVDAIRGIKAGALSRKIRYYCQECGVRLVIVDYLQKVKPDTKHEKRTYEVASVSESLKACAVETKAAFFVLAQMSREPERDKSRKGEPRGPRLSDLADSAQIERDADTVLLLQRAMPTDMASIYVAKQRDGELGVIDYTFEGQYVRFIENHETP